MNLLRLELQRNLTRRMTRLAILVAIVGILINGVVQFATHSTTFEVGTGGPDPVAEQSRSQCMSADDPYTAFYDSGGYSYTGSRVETPPFTPERSEVCDRFVFSPTFEGQRDDRFHLETLRGGLIGFAVPLIMLALILGASFIGAEWRANTIATQLIWEPRRVRVATAKLLAAVITALLVYVLLQAVATLSVLPSILLRGTTEVPDGWWRALFGSLFRAAGLVVMASAVGHALGSLGRNTSAAIGAAFVYLMILEGGLIGSIFPGSRRWLIVGNSIVWMTGSTDGTDGVTGRSMVGAGLVLLFYAAALGAASIAVFRTRDVT